MPCSSKWLHLHLIGFRTCAWSCCRHLRSNLPHIRGCNGAGSGSAETLQPPYTLKRAMKNGECRFPRGATSTGLDGPPWCVRRLEAGLEAHDCEHSSQLTLPEQHPMAICVAISGTLLLWHATGVCLRTLRMARAISLTWAAWGRRRRTPALLRRAPAGSAARHPPRSPTACRCCRHHSLYSSACVELAAPPSSTAPDQRVCDSTLLGKWLVDSLYMRRSRCGSCAGAPAARAAG